MAGTLPIASLSGPCQDGPAGRMVPTAAASRTDPTRHQCRAPVYPLAARRGELRGLPARRGGPLLVARGVLGVTGFGALCTSGLRWTSSAEGTLIHGISPLVTLLLASVLLGERIGRAQVAGGLVAFG